MREESVGCGVGLIAAGVLHGGHGWGDLTFVLTKSFKHVESSSVIKGYWMKILEPERAILQFSSEKIQLSLRKFIKSLPVKVMQYSIFFSKPLKFMPTFTNDAVICNQA